MNFDNISPEIKVYLDEISKRLFTHHAAVMVGAGFSKNAEANNESLRKNFADWNDLGNTFYEKLYGKDAKLPKKEFLNVLKLAEEVEATFGRPVLDNILQESIPDMEYEPSKLHTKLLNLPWVDIFTTNYDTLLERAAKSVFNRKYTIVLSKNDLVYASKPRIIKLHGSFPSHTPFIITEEDYRVYPKINSPFVNTVQQSLLENTLCLIGFSGEDPNFFQWLGWLRDNLGTNISKIYLIGSFKLSDTQKRLLEKRNIILVNLANNHYDALNLFIEYLSDKARSNNILLWPYEESYEIPDSKDNLEKRLTDIVSIWKNERISYPGWVILPEEKRSYFCETTEAWGDFLSDSDDVQYDIKFNFIFELCWRLDKALRPLNIEIANLIKSVLIEDINSDEKFSLALWLLKFYRQNGQNNEWKNLYLRMEGSQSLAANQKGELDYENGLHALFNLDYPMLRNITEEWQFPNNTPFENAKKAGILSEIGELSKAKEIIEKALVSIHEQQVSVNSATECSLLSQESYILNLYQWLVNRTSLTTKINKYKDYRDRIAILNLSLCNPIREQEHFTDLLSSIYKKEVDVEIQDTYDIGISKIIRYPQKHYTEQKQAFAFLLYCENVGMPFCIHTRFGKYDFVSKEALASIIRIADFNLFWSISVCCRIADKTAVETLFTRSAINNFSIDYINNLCWVLVSRLVENENYGLAENEKEITKDSINSAKNFAQILAKILPEVISRLCTKCNIRTKLEILQLINFILASKYRDCYQEVGTLIKRFMESLLPVEIKQFFIAILKLEIPTNFSIVESMTLEAPLKYLENIGFIFDKNFPLGKTILEPYYIASNSNVEPVRRWGLATLIKLNELNLLNTAQQEHLATVLWSKTNNVGLPIHTYCLRTGFIVLPHPSNTHPLHIIKKSLEDFKNYHFNLDTKPTDQNIHDITLFFKEISNLLIWNLLNEDEIQIFIDEILQFWKNNNNVLKTLNKNASRMQVQETENNLVDCFYKMQWILVSLLKALHSSYDFAKLKSMINELTNYGFSTLCLQHATNLLSDIELKNKLKLQICDIDAQKRIDALFVLESFIGAKVSDENCDLFKVLLSSILYAEDKFICYNISTLIDVVKNKFEFAERSKVDVFNVMLHLANITNYSSENSKLSFVEKLAIRQGAMQLAFILHKNWANADDEKEIKYWKECSEDENEFAEVRNMWKE